MRVEPDLARLRKRLLRRWLHDAGLDAGEAAAAIGVSPDYFHKMLAGSRVISDAVAWRLSRRFGVPFELLEPPTLRVDLCPLTAVQLRRDVVAWCHKELMPPASFADKKTITSYR